MQAGDEWLLCMGIEMTRWSSVNDQALGGQVVRRTLACYILSLGHILYKTRWIPRY